MLAELQIQAYPAGYSAGRPGVLGSVKVFEGRSNPCIHVPRVGLPRGLQVHCILIKVSLVVPTASHAFPASFAFLMPRSFCRFRSQARLLVVISAHALAVAFVHRHQSRRFRHKASSQVCVD